jgi:16S rRNA (adenine1518-N6/adenine1519-N6)-dimethyltransferase
MKLSEMKRVLAERDIRLTRSLGQNFLYDGNQLSRIVEAAELSERDKVLEIGPGLGPLTERLLARAGEVLAIEKDGRLVDFLRNRLAGESRLTLVHQDALELARDGSRGWADWKLISNLPYSVASPILVEFALREDGPRRLVVTLQQEVAERLMAGPGGKDYGVLTLLVGLRYEPTASFKIPASCFFPSPEVDSACLVLKRRPRDLLSPDQVATFVRLVKRGFSQRRKMMMKLLKRDWPESRLEGAFADLSLSPEVRAEKVSLEEFVALTRSLPS